MFDFKIVGEPIENPLDDNVDVFVRLSDGKNYVATFFTIDNIRSLMERYSKTGECLEGHYFWASDMIIVSDLTQNSIAETIEDLLRTDRFHKAFCLVQD